MSSKTTGTITIVLRENLGNLARSGALPPLLAPGWLEKPPVAQVPVVNVGSAYFGHLSAISGYVHVACNRFLKRVDQESVMYKVYVGFEWYRFEVCEVHGPRIHGRAHGPRSKLRTALRATAPMWDTSAILGHCWNAELF